MFARRIWPRVQRRPRARCLRRIRRCCRHGHGTRPTPSEVETARTHKRSMWLVARSRLRGVPSSAGSPCALDSFSSSSSSSSHAVTECTAVLDTLKLMETRASGCSGAACEWPRWTAGRGRRIWHRRAVVPSLVPDQLPFDVFSGQLSVPLSMQFVDSFESFLNVVPSCGMVSALAMRCDSTVRFCAPERRQRVEPASNWRRRAYTNLLEGCLLSLDHQDNVEKQE